MIHSVIKEVDLMRSGKAEFLKHLFLKHLADVIILTKDNSLYLQKRPRPSEGFGHISLFGGRVEENEAPKDAAIREIKEETGGAIQEQDLIFVGAVTEEWTKHTEIVHVYFWHDKGGTITGCYEHSPIEFKDRVDALSEQGLMDYARWALNKAHTMNLIK